MKTKAFKRPVAAKRVTARQGSQVVRFATSFERKLAAKIKKAARHRSGGNVSAWLAEAAKDRLRYESGAELLAWFEEKNGPLTQEELDEVDRIWPKD